MMQVAQGGGPGFTANIQLRERDESIQCAENGKEGNGQTR